MDGSNQVEQVSQRPRKITCTSSTVKSAAVARRHPQRVEVDGEIADPSARGAHQVVVVVFDVRVDPHRAGAEVEHVELAEPLEIVHGLVHGLQRDRRHVGPGAVVQRLDRRVASSPWSSRKMAWRWGVTRRPRVPEQIGQLVARLHDPDMLSTIIVDRQARAARALGRARGSCPMLLIGEIFANAARAAPDAVAATLDDHALTFGEIDAAGEPARAHGLRAAGIGRGDRVLWWGDTSLEAVPVFAALAKLGAVFAPLNARASRRRGARRSAEYARPRLLLAGASHADAGDGARRAHSASRISTEIADAAPASRPAAPELDERDPHVIFFTSGSTGRPKGVVLSHRTNWLRTFAGATDHTGRRRHRVHVPAVPHGGLDDRARRVAGPPRRCTSCASPTPRPCCDTTARAPRGPALLHPRGVGAACSSTASSGVRPVARSTKPTPARRRRRPSCCTRSRTRSRTRVTRVFYGSTEAGPALAARRRRPLPQAGQRRASPQPGVEVRLDERGEVVRAQPVPDGRLLRRSRRDRRGARRRLVPHGRPRRARRRGLPVDRRPGARRDPHRRRDGRAARGRGRARRASRRGRGRGGRRPRRRSGARS